MADTGHALTGADERPLPRALGWVALLGRRTRRILEHTGSVTWLIAAALHWLYLSLVRRRVRLGHAAIARQIVRVGVRAVVIVSIVCACVGLILTLQMAPPLEDFGSKETVANILGIAVLRELGPLIAAIVLTGFAGAAIAAEIGTMVVGEEIEALVAHALNPVRFLVVPRVIATMVAMTCLAVIADAMALAAGWATAVLALGIPAHVFLDNLLGQVALVDFLTGIFKAVVFGLIIGAVACANGLKVTGGAAGVGRATTSTVVQCVVAIIVADMVFTAIFYSLGLV